MNTIAVLGGTGKAGRFVVKELVRQGYPVKMLVRTPNTAKESNQLIEIVTGSAKSFATIQRLVTGCQAVISTLGPSKGEANINSIAAGHLIKVMQNMKIDRYIEVAGLGITTPGDKKGFRTRLISGIIRTLFPQRVRDRQKVYEMLRTVNFNWTIVRCPGIEMTDSRRKLRVSLTDSPGTKVSASDLALFIVDQLKDEQYIKKCPFVAS
jgi:putative NADH-flavin reductase